MINFFAMLLTVFALQFQTPALECSIPEQELNPVRTAVVGLLPLEFPTSIGNVSGYYYDANTACWGYLVRLHDTSFVVTERYLTREQVLSIG